MGRTQWQDVADRNQGASEEGSRDTVLRGIRLYMCEHAHSTHVLRDDWSSEFSEKLDDGEPTGAVQRPQDDHSRSLP